LEEAQLEKIRQKCKTDLKFLCKHVLGMEDWQDGLHDDLAEFIKNSSNRKKLLLIPRNHLKSSLVTVGYAIQQVLVNPNIRILITNATLRRCEEFMTQIQGYLTGASALPDLFGPFQNKNTRWTIDQLTIAQRKMGRIKEPTISVASITTNVTGGHYDLIIHDDLVERGNIGTPDQIQKVKDFFSDSLNLAPNAPIIVIGTRWAVQDLYGELLQNQDFGVFLRGALDEDDNVIFPNMVCKDRTHPKWQEMICLESQLELQGNYSFACQYMNNPVSEDSIEFKRNWTQPFDMNAELFNTFKTVEGLLSVDPAFKQNQVNDFSAFVVTKTTEDNITYILEAEQKKINAHGIIDEVFRLVDLYNIKRVLMETQVAQIVLVDMLKAEMRKRNKFFVVEEVMNSTRENKAMRIRALIPHYANGRVLHRRGLHHLEDQLIQFPRNVHDDLIDALSQQVKYWRTPTGKVITTKRAPDWSWDWWVKKLPDTRTKTQKKFGPVVRRRNWI